MTVANNILSSETIRQQGTENFSSATFDLKNYSPHEINDLPINPELIRRYRILPIKKDGAALYLGMSNPADQATIDAIGFHTGLKIYPLRVSDSDLDTLIKTHYSENLLNSHLELALLTTSTGEEKRPPKENNENDDEPVINFADHLIHDAIQKSVSDIHLEPYEKDCRIRYRRDGLLYEMTTIPHHLAIRLITRLKIMARLDIAERRLPQDGRFQFNQQAKIDVRLNTCPTLFGEKLVLRLLDAKQITLDIHTLGFNETQKNLFLEKISHPQGLILVTGPTGSGKTVTLYSALHYLNRAEKNILTVEDPVEIQLTGINQVSVNPKIGLHFSTVLRTFLRQDPDIIMVGEIRDTETANIAIQAAETGHLVLSTLHTNSAIETISRLQSMGITAYNLVSAVSLVIAQRLVRKLCVHCKKPAALLHHTETASYQPVGCQHCYRGYQGRIGIFELVPMTEKIAQRILSQASIYRLTRRIKKEGISLLWDAGLEKVRDGITSFSEINRVLIR